MAPPLKRIDAEQVFKLARIGCTEAEIADILGVSQPTISRRFRIQVARARGEFKSSLRRAQYHRAVKDRSDSMLIHMGKVHLGQGEGQGGADGPTVAEIARAMAHATNGNGDRPGAGRLPG